MQPRTRLALTAVALISSACASAPPVAPKAPTITQDQKISWILRLEDQRILRAPDGDIHLDFAPVLDRQGRLLPFVSAEITPEWSRGSEHWRYPYLVAAFRPNAGGVTPWDSGPRRVRLRGWLMYDYVYEGQRPPFGFPPKISFWEIHPVTGIELWNDRAGRFAELPR